MQSKKLKTQNMPTLDKVVLDALYLIGKTKLPEIKIPFKKPIAVGSSNAFYTGQIILENHKAIFADESSFFSKLKTNKDADGVIIISASGSKHAGIIAKEAKSQKLQIQLWTCSKNPPAKIEAKLDDKEIFIFPSNPEPYTYNTSTYGSMIFAKTKENPSDLLKVIKKDIDKSIPKNFGKYNGYYVILPSKYHYFCDMIKTKFVELFGLSLPCFVYTDEQMKHAKDIIKLKNIASIELGEVSYHARQAKIVSIPIEKNTLSGSFMMICFYIVGKIQSMKKPLFFENINSYCIDSSKTFNKKIEPIVKY